MPEYDLTPMPDISESRQLMGAPGFRFLTNHPIIPLDGETPLGKYLRDLRWAYGEANVLVTDAVDNGGNPMPMDKAIYIREGIVPRQRWWKKLLDRWLS